jgi:hypothetical protein
MHTLLWHWNSHCLAQQAQYRPYTALHATLRNTAGYWIPQAKVGMSEASDDSMEQDEQQQQADSAQAHSAARAVFTVEPARPSAAAQARGSAASSSSAAAASAAAAAAVPAELQSLVLPLAARLPQRRRQTPTPLMHMVPSAASWRRGTADSAAAAAANGGAYSSGDTSAPRQPARQRRGSASAAGSGDEEDYVVLREAKVIRVGERYQAAIIPACRSKGEC